MLMSDVFGGYGMIEEHTRYSRLAQITKLINTKLELDDVLEYVVTAISEEIFQCDSVGIYLPQEDHTYRGYIGKPNHFNGITLNTLVIDPKTDKLAKQVLDRKETIYIPDTTKDNRPDPRPIKAFGINSLLALPIFYEEEVYGLVFLFNNGVKMNLTPFEIEAVEAYVNMAAVAIRNANEITNKENLISEKQLLLDVTSELSLCSSLNEALDKCFYYVGKVLRNSNIGAHLLNPITEGNYQATSLSKQSDWSEKAWKETHRTIRIDYTTDLLFQEVIETKKSIFVEDVTKDSRPNQEACREFGIQSILMLPIVTMGEVLGLLAIVGLNHQNPRYTEAGIKLAQSIVEATASVLSHLIFMEKQEQIIKKRTEELTEKNAELETVVGELQRLSRENELILHSVGDGIVGLDIKGKITFCNPAAESILKYREKELLGKSYLSFFKQKKILPKGVLFEKMTSEEDDVFLQKNGDEIPVEYTVSAIEDQSETVGYVVACKDISYRKKMEEKVNYHAYYDSLTKLPNRSLLKDRLEQSLEYAQLHHQKLALIFLDLDRFKTINDTLGHSLGDLLLQKVSERLRNCVHKGCTVSRQGGDEFTILLPFIRREEEVYSFSQKLIKTFEEPFELDGTEIFVKTSIGISMFPQDGLSSQELIKKADTAMYKAKELAGNDFQFYTASMDKRTIDNVRLENALYRALELNEMMVYYQPQIDYKSNHLIGVEALLRWNHKILGMISPAEFIPIAEENGLIVPIGKWVLQQACKQMKQWQQEGHRGMTVSVNVSAQQFMKDNFVNMVKNILEDVDLDPCYLGIELTENLIVQNTDETLRKLEELHDLGVKISIDDFGTGYSSLGYLSHFPIHTLKIDRSFIHNVCQDTKNAAITSTIITLAQNLQLDVIAEGVETKEQIEFLVSRNCTLLQGYYYSPPLDIKQLEKKFLRSE